MIEQILKLNGSTKILGIIGGGISHSLSPLIHNFSIQSLGLDQIYIPFDLSRKFPSKDFFEIMWDIGAIGFNITAPWKKIAAESFHGSPASSINTIYRGHAGWETASTDGAGFIRGLKELGYAHNDFKEVIFLGNGGAATAIHDHLMSQMPRQKHIVLRRSEGRDLDWVRLGSNCIEFASFSPDVLKNLIGKYPEALLIQCTNAPLQGVLLDEFCETLLGFRGVFVDLLYKHPSALLDQARAMKIPTQDGLGMLVGQALLSQELWWGKGMDFDVILSYLKSSVID